MRERILPRLARTLSQTAARAALAASLCLLSVLLLGGCGGQIAGDVTPGGTQTSSPVSAESARPTQSPRHATRRYLRYAVLGDSYSNGQSVSSQAAWPVVMAGLLTRAGLPVEIVANPSITGATTAQMLSVGIGPIRASRPQVMTVMLGVNDQYQGHSPAQFAADYRRALADAIAITGSPRRVLAVDIPDYAVTPVAAQIGDPAQIAQSIEAFNRTLDRVAAAAHVQVVSVFGISRRDGASELADDGLHPSAAQLQQWAQHIEPVALHAWRGLVPRSG